MSIAAILAFITTANAGLLAASRDPMAMSKDQLLPKKFSYISKNGTPVYSIVFTSFFMIFVIVFLDIESLVKTASLLKILLFLFVILSLIIMRESKIRHYRPKFSSPFYPWIQIIGIIGLIFLIIEMGFIPMSIVGCFIGIGFLWYWFYARDKIWREYSLMHVVDRITDKTSTTFMTDEELREIIIQRDEIEEKRFEQLIKNSNILDIYKYLAPDKLFEVISEELSDKLKIKKELLFKLLKSRKQDSNVVIHPGIAIFSHRIKGRNTFEILFIRTKKGLIISKDIDPIYSFFIIVATPDQQNFYLHALMWFVQIAENPEFEKKWIESRNVNELKETLLNAWKNRKI